MEKCFNSTLVQLKVPTRPFFGSNFHSFNSTLVQLKVVLSSLDFLYKSCFNSTLVQLKEVEEKPDRYEITVFQFYLSSIKRGRSQSKL